MRSSASPERPEASHSRLLVSRVPDAFLGQTLNPIDIDLRAWSGVCVERRRGSWCRPAACLAGHSQRPMESLRTLDRPRRSHQSRQGGRVARGCGSPSLLAARGFRIPPAVVRQSRSCRSWPRHGWRHSPETRLAANRAGGSRSRQISTRGNVAPGADGPWPEYEGVDAALSAWPAVGAVAFSQNCSRSAAAEEAPSGSMKRTTGSKATATGSGHRSSVDRDPRASRPHVAPGDTEADVILGERLAGMLWPGTDQSGKPFPSVATRPAA